MRVRKLGRPDNPVDWKVFEALCSVQCTRTEIASKMNIPSATLDRQIKKQYGATFKEVFSRFKDIGKTSLRSWMFGAAQKGSVPMMIHLSKQYLDHTDKVETEMNANMNVSNGEALNVIFGGTSEQSESAMKYQDELLAKMKAQK